MEPWYEEFAVAITTIIVVCIAALVLILPVWWRALDRRVLLRIAEKAVDSDRPLPPELFSMLAYGRPRPSPTDDLRRGVRLTSIGFAMALIGLCVFGAMVGHTPTGAMTAGSLVAALGAIPLALGVGYVLLGRRPPTDDAI
jgi:hypothetical protein